MINHATFARADATGRAIPVFESLVAALESVNDCVIISDAGGIIRYMNHRAEALTGWAATDALRRRLDDVLTLLGEKKGGQNATASTMLARWRSGGKATARFVLVDRSGRRLPVEFQSQARPFGRALTEQILLFRDLSDQVRAEQATARLLVVEESNRSKDRFLSMMAHEIRNPLTAISSAAEEMASRDDAPDDIRAEAEILRLNSVQIARLLRDILDSRRPATGFHIVHATVDLHALVRHTIRSLRRDIDTKEIEWNLELDADRHLVHADAERLQQVLWNLVSNAVKFTPVGGRITIRSSNREDRQLRIEVSDTGIGIDPEQLPRVFDMYYHGSSASVGGTAGWGIGLAVSKAIVEAHRGRLNVWSAGRERGATFTLELDLLEV